MRDRRCFVQFMHPRGEHRQMWVTSKYWNRCEHRHKYLKSAGRYLDGEKMREGEIVFWGELGARISSHPALRAGFT
jgi:hypothetical protein